MGVGNVEGYPIMRDNQNASMKSKPSILVVDDESRITDNLVPCLSRAGFLVAVASNGQEALDHLTSKSVDMVVMDVIMPRLDGREVLRSLRKAGNWTPIILLTQVGESFERAIALEEGADDYLNKPFDAHELVARIMAMLPFFSIALRRL
jgi:DNA-binding response OmpR family regulator